MSTGNKNIVPVNWQEVPNKELGLDKASPEDITMEAKKHREAEEAEKRAHEAEEAEKRVCEAEAQHQEVAVVERQREAEWQREAEQQEAERAKEKCEWLVTKIGSVHVMTLPWGGKKKKRTRRVWPIFDNDNDDNNNIVVMSTCKARKAESGAQETMVQVVDRRMGEVVKELWGLRKGVATMAKSNWDLTQVLYCRFQSMDTLVNEVQIFGAEDFLPKPALESEPAKDKLQETLREVKELQEECLEWAMECLQMRKEWMWQEEATLTKCLKGKGKELAKESKQEEEEQRTGDEEKEGEAE
ncbi:hypothetical protein ID866_11972 [Astraeus odoratus]|nr:hypothetical protein ID866_11972 [Astraeus odoratus]